MGDSGSPSPGRDTTGGGPGALIGGTVRSGKAPASALVNGFHRVTANPEPSPLATLEEVERAHILKVLEVTAWRVSGKPGAAELLGLPPTTLRSRLRELGIVKKP